MKRMNFSQNSILSLVRTFMVAMVFIFGVSSTVNAQALVSESQAIQVLQDEVVSIQASLDAAHSNASISEAIPADYRSNQVNIVLYQDVLFYLNEGQTTLAAVRQGLIDNESKALPQDLKAARETLVELLTQ